MQCEYQEAVEYHSFHIVVPQYTGTIFSNKIYIAQILRTSHVLEFFTHLTLNSKKNPIFCHLEADQRY